MIENYKKQGLEEAENQFICTQRRIFLRGIPKNLVIANKIQLEHLTCQLCHNIIWKAVTCSQNNCFANFCEYCVSNYSQQQTSQENGEQQTCSKCPKCSKVFYKTSIPLINNLLSDLKLHCFYKDDGCSEVISYDGYLKHCLNCDCRRIACQGCKQNFLQREIGEHNKSCEKILTKCPKCSIQLPQLHFAKIHTPVHCLQQQLDKKTEKIYTLENKLENLQLRLNDYETLIEKIIKGENLQLPYHLYSSFPSNFQFLRDNTTIHLPLNLGPSLLNQMYIATTQQVQTNQNMGVKLYKASYNSTKQKFDFLHFYIASPIKTQSPIGFQWKMMIKRLKGNLLIGICSSLYNNSVDFVINRFGEIKKKQPSENKYRLIRKCNLIFTEGDVITFKYLALRKILKIENENKKIDGMLENREILELGDVFYSFYSLDTAGDMIKFLIK